ncbi:uncharacterized protein LOC126835872 [Adelges cooleyi]|uniref:uncharacterized protein LOC126835872 n=1 Tax=Adelges cooleyi TaxID=133065 RepID=UPI00217F83A5|nr:uncharacterized protein LOC126835872 [Adelges cooleyi]
MEKVYSTNHENVNFPETFSDLESYLNNIIKLNYKNIREEYSVDKNVSLVSSLRELYTQTNDSLSILKQFNDRLWDRYLAVKKQASDQQHELSEIFEKHIVLTRQVAELNEMVEQRQEQSIFLNKEIECAAKSSEVAKDWELSLILDNKKQEHTLDKLMFDLEKTTFNVNQKSLLHDLNEIIKKDLEKQVGSQNILVKLETEKLSAFQRGTEEKLALFVDKLDMAEAKTNTLHCDVINTEKLSKIKLDIQESEKTLNELIKNKNEQDIIIEENIAKLKKDKDVMLYTCDTYEKNLKTQETKFITDIYKTKLINEKQFLEMKLLGKQQRCKIIANKLHKIEDMQTKVSQNDYMTKTSNDTISDIRTGCGGDTEKR